MHNPRFSNVLQNQMAKVVADHLGIAVPTNAAEYTMFTEQYGLTERDIMSGSNKVLEMIKEQQRVADGINK